MFRTLFLISLLGFSILVGSWRVAQRQIVDFAAVDEAQPADAAVVLGAAVIRGRPSSVLRARIDHAIQLYEAGLVNTIIFTGGVGNNDQVSEAAVARQYAVSRGIPQSATLIEEESTNTIENLRNAQAVGRENQIETYLIVSTPYHMARATWIARDLEMEAYSSPTRTIRWRSDQTKQAALTQETISYLLHIVRRWGL